MLKIKPLKRKADSLFSEKVRAIGSCEKCGKDYNLQCCHVITRSNLRLRYDKKNVLCLCSGCHMWWHHEPLEAITWFMNKYPTRYKYLMKAKNEILKINYQEEIDKLK